MNQSKLDAVAGAQLAMTAVLAVLLQKHRGDLVTEVLVSQRLELVRANLMASSVPDDELRHFESTAETMLAALKAS